MTETKHLKIAIISDPHAYHGATTDSGPSWIAMGADQSNPILNPFAGLKKLIAEQGLAADLVFCGGDLGDKAVPQAQQYAWSEVNDVAKLLGAAEVLGAAGNHDIDSRLQHTDHDAKGQILALAPHFPTFRHENWLEYWARNYTVLFHNEVRFLLLNSSAFHGYHAKDKPPEYEHGRVTDRTIDDIKADSRLKSEAPANVLLCHHHPFKNDKIKVTDYSQMQNGDRLLNELEEIDCGPWLILHGHKHVPRIFYAPGSSSAPTIFSAGSFAAKPWAELQNAARNEFYILSIDLQGSAASSAVKGIVNIWQWSHGLGWHIPREPSGLGRSAGFGSRTDLAHLARQIAQTYKPSLSGASLPWSEVCEAFPDVRYLVPDDQRRLVKTLEDKHSFRPLFHDGQLAEFGVP